MKKLLTMLLALMMVLSLVACSSGDDKASEANSDDDAVVEEVADNEEAPADDAEVPADDDEVAPSDDDAGDAGFPELDGYTMSEQMGAVTYIADDGSVIAVQSTPADAESIALFEEQSDEIVAELNSQMTAMLSSVMPGSEAVGEFMTVEGKTVFSVTMTMSGAELGLDEDMTVMVYMVPDGDDFVGISGIGMGKDITGDMAKIVAAL